MYFKTPDSRSRSEIRVPLGYRGNAFPSSSQPKPAAPEQRAPAPEPRAPAPKESPKMSEKAFEKFKEMPLTVQNEPQTVPDEEKEPDKCEICEVKKNAPEKKSILGGILSPEGSLDAEELLILALALIIFQGGKENELALLLLALLFIK